MFFRSLKFLFISFSIAALAACTSGGGDDNGSNGGGGDSGGGSSSSLEFRTSCGTVFGEELLNPIKASEGEDVVILEIVSHNTFIVSPQAGGQILVKLHGISDSISKVQAGRAADLLAAFGLKAIMIRPSETGCGVTTDGGGAGSAVALFTTGGTSYAEALLKAGGANASSSDPCMVSLISSCYRALEDDAEAELPQTGATISRFLWKPVSERDGRLVVLISPSASTIIAGGEVLNLTGGSNGFSQTGRGTRAGCGYGANVTVEARDSQGRTLVWPDGSLSFNIPNGCDRVEF
jgi:hypothetical protein